MYYILFYILYIIYNLFIYFIYILCVCVYIYIYKICLQDGSQGGHQYSLAAKESGLECTCMNNDDFTALIIWGGRLHRVSMYVAKAFKMTE